MEREHKGDTMNLHDKGTDRLLRDLDIKPEGTATAAGMLESARIVAGWSMRDVLDYLGGHYAPSLEYPPDADAELMRITDDANRAAAIVYRSGHPHSPRSLDCAERALQAAKPAPLAILGPGGTYTKEIR